MNKKQPSSVKLHSEAQTSSLQELKWETAFRAGGGRFRSFLSVSSCYSSCFSVMRQFVSGALGKRWKRASLGLVARTENAASKRAICSAHVVSGFDGSMKQSSSSVSLSVSRSHFRNGPNRFEFPCVFGPEKKRNRQWAGQKDSDVPLRHFRVQSEHKGWFTHAEGEPRSGNQPAPLKDDATLFFPSLKCVYVCVDGVETGRFFFFFSWPYSHPHTHTHTHTHTNTGGCN